MKDITTATWYFEEGLSWWTRQTTKHAERIIVKLGDEVRHIDKAAKHLLELCRREQEEIDRLTSEQHQLDAKIKSDFKLKSALRMVEDHRNKGIQAGRSVRTFDHVQRKTIWNIQQNLIRTSRNDQIRIQSRYMLMRSLHLGMTAHHNVSAAFVTLLSKLPRLSRTMSKELGYDASLQTIYDFAVLQNEFWAENRVDTLRRIAVEGFPSDDKVMKLRQYVARLRSDAAMVVKEIRSIDVFNAKQIDCQVSSAGVLFHDLTKDYQESWLFRPT